MSRRGYKEAYLLFACFTPSENSLTANFQLPLTGAPFGCGTSSNPKAVPACGGFEPSAPSGRCSEGRIGRNREYCKRQRSKTTIFQPAFVAANVMSSRKGNGLEMLTAASYSPPQLRLRSAAPPQAVEPFGFPPTEKSPIGALFIACLFSLILISSRSRCSCRGRTGPCRGHSPRAGSCCRNSRGNSSRSSSRSRGRSPWGRCWSGTW